MALSRFLTATGLAAATLAPLGASSAPLGYASNEKSGNLSVIDTATGKVVATLRFGEKPRGIALSTDGIGFLPGGSRAYVAAENADTVNVLDTAKQEVIARIKAEKRSNGVIVHPDGKRVFVSSGGDGTVQVIDTATNAIVATIPVGKRPWNMALTPDGSKLYVACARTPWQSSTLART